MRYVTETGGESYDSGADSQVDSRDVGIAVSGIDCLPGVVEDELSMNDLLGLFGVVWAALGVNGLLLFAIYRLTPKTVAAYEGGLSTSQWWIMGIVCVAMLYAEGYRGFQLRFSPRTAARIRYLRDRPNAVRSLFAPLFAMGFFHATRRTKITAYCLSFGILILVLLVHRLAQPWRGIIDAGVVIGLGWGALTLCACIVRALTSPRYEPSPEVPAGYGEADSGHRGSGSRDA